MTTPDAPQGRPVPDTDDLRLLAEIINNGAIGLPQAAWNARMSQAEAAARFVTMAERGMPLRLVAEGDRQLLWNIAQAGPATGGVPVQQQGIQPQPQPQPQPAPPVQQQPLPAQPGQPAPFPAPGQPPVPPSLPPFQPPVVQAPAIQQPPVLQPPMSQPQPVYPSPAPPAGPPLLAGPPPLAAPPPLPAGPPMSMAGAQMESQPVQQLPVVDPSQPVAPPVNLPPASAVPPHEQAIAGAVPLGQPPFGTPPAEPAPEGAAVPGAAVETPAATWGLPGTSNWARSDEPAVPPAPSGAGPGVPLPAEPTLEPDMTQSYPAPRPGDEDEDGDAEAGTNQAGADEDQHDKPAAADEPVQQDSPPEPAPAPSATRRVMISGQPMQSIVGLFGEHLDVSLQNVVDPADQILRDAGYRLDAAERALLVQTSVGNRGPVDYESLPDLYLVLVSSTGAVLPKAAMAVSGYPAHRVGVPAGTQVSGWTVFLVPGDTEVAEVRWSVRPDLPNRTVSWGFGPA